LATHVADPRQQAIYGIIHGGKDLSLRQQSLDFLAPLPFHGLAIGGSLGGTQEEMLQILAHLAPALARHPPVARKPRHLLGIGDPFSLRRAVSFGIDTFDSVFPTRAARHGNLFTLDEESLEMQSLPLRNIQFRDDLAPVDPCCPCPVCQRHSRAFLHHLIRAREPLLGVLATTHNLYTWERLMTLLRQRIALNQI
jgi:queuine tRNA-ribosyltransferase